MNWLSIMKLVFQYIPVIAQIIREIMEKFDKEPAQVQMVAKQNLQAVLAQKNVESLKTLCAIHGECHLKK